MAGEYQDSIKKISTFITDFQKVKLVTSVFEFFDEISPYSYGWSHKKEILRTKFPNVSNFLDDYNKCLTILNEQLLESYNCNKRSDSKKLGIKLDEIIEHLDNQLEPEKVKEKIRKDYIPKNLFEEKQMFGIPVPKSYIWSDFKIEMLETEYLFDDYFGMLYNLLEAFRYVVEQFKTGYKNGKVAKGSDLLTKRAPNSSLDEIIFPEKWGDFIERCNYYSKEREFDDGLIAAKVITKRGDYNFHWIGIGNSVIPTLGEFVNLLASNEFFVFDQRMLICRSFLKFFHLPSEIENAKFLSKQASKQKSKFKGFFTLRNS